MGALIGLGLGLGLLLIWRSGSRRPLPRAPRTGGLTARRSRMITESGVGAVSSTQLWFVQTFVGLLAVVVILVATSSVAIALIFGVFGFFLPMAMVTRLQRKRAADLREVWPEAVDHIASGVRAGLSMPEALSGLGSRGPDPLRPAFLAFGADYRASGRFFDCLDLLKERLADPVGDRVCETLRVTREVGGTELGTVLRTLSQFLREEGRVRAELETRQGWTVNAARLAVAAPWLVLLLLGTQSSTLAAYDTPTGVVVLLVGGVVCVLAYRLMLQLGRLPVERRVLT